MVKRYDIDCHEVELYEQPDGEAVKYEDYEKLLAVARKLQFLAEYNAPTRVEVVALVEAEELLGPVDFDAMSEVLKND